jgi:hypothetical protein
MGSAPVLTIRGLFMESSPRRAADNGPRDDTGSHSGSRSTAHEHDRPREPSASDRAAVEDTLDEVQTYLQELFGRYGLSQSKPADSPGSTARPVEAKPKSEDPAPQTTRPPEAETLRSLPDPKRPPERRDDILVLRELSTRSARGAIAQFEKGRIVTATWARFWLCFAALGLTLFFLRIVEPFEVRTLCAAAVALILAVYWCGQFWLLTRQATRLGTKAAR